MQCCTCAGCIRLQRIPDSGLRRRIPWHKSCVHTKSLTWQSSFAHRICMRHCLTALDWTAMTKLCDSTTLAYDAACVYIMLYVKCIVVHAEHDYGSLSLLHRTSCNISSLPCHTTVHCSISACIRVDPHSNNLMSSTSWYHISAASSRPRGMAGRGRTAHNDRERRSC